eukprot:752321-Hanusia_phi.AAC.4
MSRELSERTGTGRRRLREQILQLTRLGQLDDALLLLERLPSVTDALGLMQELQQDLLRQRLPREAEAIRALCPADAQNLVRARSGMARDGEGGRREALATLKLCIKRAQDLPVKDGLTGTSDPFCLILLKEVAGPSQPRVVCERSTSRRMYTLNPVWEESFELEVWEEQAALELAVYDWDEDESNDYIGSVTLDLSVKLRQLLQKREEVVKHNMRIAQDAAAPGLPSSSLSSSFSGRTLGLASTSRSPLRSAGIGELARYPLQLRTALGEGQEEEHERELRSLSGERQGVLVFSTSFRLHVSLVRTCGSDMPAGASTPSPRAAAVSARALPASDVSRGEVRGRGVALQQEEARRALLQDEEADQPGAVAARLPAASLPLREHHAR